MAGMAGAQASTCWVQLGQVSSCFGSIEVRCFGWIKSYVESVKGPLVRLLITSAHLDQSICLSLCLYATFVC